MVFENGNVYRCGFRELRATHAEEFVKLSGMATNPNLAPNERGLHAYRDILKFRGRKTEIGTVTGSVLVCYV
jgi:hypothetical protein